MDEIINAAVNCPVDLEIYTSREILDFRVMLTNDQRLIDLLNHSGGISRNNKNDFIELQQTPPQDGLCPPRRKEYIQKSTIEFIALSEVGLGRGFGAKGEKDKYPYVRKSSVLVNIHCPTFTLIGNMHLMEGQTPQDLLNANKQFIPLTDVTINRENKILEYRPFVAVNKLQIYWLEVEESSKIQNTSSMAT
jgi:hypothetical protein